MTFLVLLCRHDGVQKAKHSHCVGHCISQVDLPSRKGWRMIYGCCEVVMYGTKGGLIGQSPLEKEGFCSWKPRPTRTWDEWVWWFAAEEPQGRFEGSSAFPDVERKGICVEVGSLPALWLGSLPSGPSTASCYLASVSSWLKWRINLSWLELLLLP